MPPYGHIKQKKSILSFVITLSLMVLLNRVLPLSLNAQCQRYTEQIFEIQIQILHNRINEGIKY